MGKDSVRTKVRILELKPSYANQFCTTIVDNGLSVDLPNEQLTWVSTKGTNIERVMQGASSYLLIRNAACINGVEPNLSIKSTSCPLAIK